MRLYHYSVDSYKGGDCLINDFKKGYRFAEPFLLALRESMGTFKTVYFSAMYTGRELVALNLRKYENYRKDAVEGIFEFVREQEFPEEPSRIDCVYYCSTKEEAIAYAEDDCISSGLFSKDQVRLLEVEVDERRIREYDQRFYNMAMDHIEKNQFEAVFDCARKYYSMERTEEPLIELVCDGSNKIICEIAY